MKIFLCILFFFVWTSRCKGKFDPGNFDYCTVSEGENCKPGTKNPNTGEHPACRCEVASDRTEIFAENEEEMVKFRELMLEAHNELRNHIASGAETRIAAKFAADMMILNWDVEMEYYARCRVMGSLANKKYSSQFVAHEKCMKTQNGGYYGQNFACTSGKSDSKTMKELVQSWYEKEVTKVKMTPTFFEKYKYQMGVGHFTQVVWSRATRLGCVVVRLPPSTLLEKCTLVIVCNYYSDLVKFGGNMMGAFMYKQVDSKDETCTQCYNGTTCDKKSKYPFLCGKLESVPRKTLTPKNGSSARFAQDRIVIAVTVLITTFFN